MDRPPGGWNDLVTNQTLDLKLDALRSELHSDMSTLRGEMSELRIELRSEMAQLSSDVVASVDRRLRSQAWIMTSTMIASVGLAATLAATLSH